MGGLDTAGTMKVPFSGQFNHLWAVFGVVWAICLILGVFLSTEMAGPAATGATLAESCKWTGLVTCGWCIIYYNYLGTQVNCMAIIRIYELISPTDVGPEFAQVASRF